MDEKTNFIVYCIEEYKNAKGMNGKSVIDLFNRYRVIDYMTLEEITKQIEKNGNTKESQNWRKNNEEICSF